MGRRHDLRDRDGLADAPEKRVCCFGMSGSGQDAPGPSCASRDGWFHYSIDYRIGTRYMGELIADSFKREAMKVPFLRECC